MFERKAAYYPPLAGAGYSIKRDIRMGVDYAITIFITIK